MAGDAVCRLCRGRAVIVEPTAVAVRGAPCPCVGICAACQGRGWTVGEAGAARCPCKALDERLRLLADCGVPPRYADASLDGFARRLADHDRIVDAVRRWVERHPPDCGGLLFVGPVGLGKTHLAAATVLSLVLDRGVPAQFVEWFDLLHRIRASYDGGGRDRDILGPLLDVPVLVIDELGKGRTGSEWEASVIDHLVSTRYARGLATCYTTNYPVTDDPKVLREHRGDLPLVDKVGARVHSRVLGTCEIVALHGAPDYRIAVQAQRVQSLRNDDD